MSRVGFREEDRSMEAHQSFLDAWRISDVEPPLPEKVGPYHIEREIGKGTLGTVYLGRDTRSGAKVAVKTIPLADEFEEAHLERVRERFFSEAESASRLDHPAIVSIYEVGESDNLVYVVMEYLEGRRLSEHITPDRLLPVPVVLELMARVAEAVDYAHRRSVLHGDLKPANLLYKVETDEIKITDFGIARLTDSGRTKTGIRLGTPSFTPPEQLAGEKMTNRSDLFSLGVALYQLLTGRLPFQADSMTALMHRIATDKHTPLNEARAELPENLEEPVRRALVKDPVDRFARGSELALALRDQLAALTETKDRV